MRTGRNGAASLALAALAWLLAACASTPVAPYAGEGPRLQTIYVIAAGWHTEIGVPADALSGSLAVLRKDAPDARYFVFGWGERDYYMSANPGLGDLLEGAVPEPSVLLVVPMQRPPSAFFAAGTTVYAIPVSQGGLDRLSEFLGYYFERDPQNLLRRVGDGPYPGSSFYASRGSYSMENTCNTWTADALRVAGLPVSPGGVVFAGQVVSQVKDLAGPAPAPAKP